MRLSELIQGIGRLIDPNGVDPEVTHITHDSRKVHGGSLFVAITGATADGHDFIAGATQCGLSCVMTDQPDRVPCCIPIVQVENTREAMAKISRRLYGMPDQKLKVIGVTGTNGKTSITYLVNHLLGVRGRTGRIGTLSYFNGLSEEQATRTTPESNELFRYLAEMVSNVCKYAAIEVSSHGLAMGRAHALELSYGIFTNLSHDHMDFHKDMEDYFQAKQRMFSMIRQGGTAVINVDDEYGRRIEVPSGLRTITYGTRADADLRFELEDITIEGSRFKLFFDGRSALFHLPMLGKHNIYNFTAAAAVALSEGITMDELTQLPTNVHIPGRAEFLKLGQDFAVVVDFAHSPDALEKIHIACRDAKPKRLITVFGAGGDRDRDKRPRMGAVVDKHADIAVLTSDNPRGEDPQAIIKMVAAGLNRSVGADFIQEVDRERAIRKALDLAQTGDLVLIAGKGHETTQEIKGKRYPFDDRMVATRLLLAMRGH